MAKKKKKSLLGVLVGGVALGFCKAIFEEPKTEKQKIAAQRQRRRRQRSWWMN